MGFQKTYASAPVFVADPSSMDLNTGRQIDWNYVTDAYLAGTRYTVTLDEAALAAATSLTVVALTVAIPIGTILDFAGTGLFAKTTAPAAIGATTVAVEALPEAIADTKTATFIVSQSHQKVIPAGTVMCQLSSGKMVPRAIRPGSEAAIGILIATARQNSESDALSGHGVIVGGVIYENLLPETITSYKSELASAGTGFNYQTYADSSEV